MSELLIAETMSVEKYKQAIPEMERMLARNACQYMAGTLLLDVPDPYGKSCFTQIDIMSIDDVASDIIRKGQYLASLIYVKHKRESCTFYKQAQQNIKIYEQAHGRELEPSGTGEIN